MKRAEDAGEIVGKKERLKQWPSSVPLMPLFAIGPHSSVTKVWNCALHFSWGLLEVEKAGRATC